MQVTDTGLDSDLNSDDLQETKVLYLCIQPPGTSRQCRMQKDVLHIGNFDSRALRET